MLSINAVLFYTTVHLESERFYRIEEVVDGWIQNLWPALKKAIGIQKLGSQSIETPISAPIIEVESEKTKSATCDNNNIGEMAGKTNSATSIPANVETKALTLPRAPTKSLIMEYSDAKGSDYDLLKPAAPYPLIEGSPIEASISGAKVLTKPGALKTTLEVVLEVSEVSHHHHRHINSKLRLNHEKVRSLKW